MCLVSLKGNIFLATQLPIPVPIPGLQVKIPQQFRYCNCTCIFAYICIKQYFISSLVMYQRSSTDIQPTYVSKQYWSMRCYCSWWWRCHRLFSSPRPFRSRESHSEALGSLLISQCNALIAPIDRYLIGCVYSRGNSLEQTDLFSQFLSQWVWHKKRVPQMISTPLALNSS